MARTLNDPPTIGESRACVVRKAEMADLRGIVKIHQKAFSQFFLTRLGPAFLREYYRMVLDYRAGIILVSERDRGPEGFVCGFAEPAEFYRSMWHNKRAFMLPALPALIRHPTMIGNVLEGAYRVQASAAQGPARSCELSSIAVAPEAAGHGFGKVLVGSFLTHSWAMNAECVYLTTDADANEAANALYSDSGFQLARRFLQRKGRWMNEYVIHRAQGDQKWDGQR